MNDINKPLVNRVANSGLITINLEQYFPEEEIILFDLKDYLFKGLILKEKDFRLALKEIDWEQYKGKYVCVFCSADAIIPQWAYMLVAAYATPFAKDIILGDLETFLNQWYREKLKNLPVEDYKDGRIVIKGCSGKPVPPSAYLELTRILHPHVQSIMYGEPCSTVPVFKRPRKIKES